VREQGKKCGALLFSLNFLWLLSLFQDKESYNKDRLTTKKRTSKTSGVSLRRDFALIFLLLFLSRKKVNANPVA
jgi:hypothetical protein